MINLQCRVRRENLVTKTPPKASGKSQQIPRDANVGPFGCNITNIRTFLVAVDLCSFKAAGKYLFISPSAVSHRIAALEEELGFKLFHRLTRSIRITPEGERLYATCTEAFEKIMAEVRYIKGGAASGTLSIFSHPSVAQSWLAPRLGDFHRQHPQYRIHVRTGNTPVDFANSGFDLALYYADGVFTGLHAQKLMDEEIFPVCSPAYAKKHRLLDKPENLAQCTLLYDGDAWHYSELAAEWSSWNRKRWDFMNRAAIISFDHSLSCALAAVTGTGVAMGRARIVDRYIADGSLMEVFPSIERVRSAFAYHAVWPKKDSLSPVHGLFLRWLIRQAGAPLSS